MAVLSSATWADVSHADVTRVVRREEEPWAKAMNELYGPFDIGPRKVISSIRA
jgi:hypothetical protein